MCSLLLSTRKSANFLPQRILKLVTKFATDGVEWYLGGLGNALRKIDILYFAVLWQSGADELLHVAMQKCFSR